MRIDEALAESKPLAVVFGDAILNVEYRPPWYTLEQISEAQKDGENMERLISMLQDVVLGWDLTRVVTEDGAEKEVPVDVTNRDEVYRFVPSPIIMKIIKAIRADNDVSGE